MSEVLGLPELDAPHTLEYENIARGDLANRHDLLNNFRAFILDYQNPDTSIGQLDIRQSETLRRLYQFANQPGEDQNDLGRFGYADLCCGYGKSAIAVYAARAVGAGQIMPDGQKRQVALFTSRKTIVNQFANSNHHRGEFDQIVSDFEYFAPELSVSIFPDESRNMDADVVIMTYSVLDSMNARNHHGRFSVCLLDEAHNIGHKRLQSLNELASNELVAGLTGTPERLKHKVPEQIDSVTVADGILDHKFLSGALIKVIQTPFLYSGQASSGELSADEARNELLVDTMASWASQHGVGFVKSFNANQAVSNHAELLAEMAGERTIVDRDGIARRLHAEAVGDFRKDTADVIQAFSQDTYDTDILIAPKALNEGVNVPRLGWALWTHPTIDANGLQQFFGRGLRIDPRHPDKLFVFGQTLDTRARWYRNSHASYIWHQFGIEEPPVDSLYVGRPEQIPDNFSGQMVRDASMSTITYNRRKNYIHELTSEIDAELLFNELSLIEISSSSESKADTFVHPLTALENQFAMDRNWLRTVLGDTGFTARVRCVGETIDYWYEEDALSILQDSVARPGDRFAAKIAEEAGITVSQVLNLASEEGIEIVRLYPYESLSHNRKLLYALRAADYQRLISQDKLPQPLMPHEITMVEIAQRIDLAIPTNRLSTHLYSRGFDLNQRSVRGSRAKDKWLGDREAIEAWIDAYRNAPPLPPNYTPVSSFCWKTKSKIAFEAARQSGIAIHLFRSKGIVSEYIHGDDDATFKDAIRQLAQDTAQNIPGSLKLYRMSQQEYTVGALATLAGLSQELASREQQALDIQHDASERLTPIDYDKLRLRLLRIRRELDAINDEPLLRAAATQRAASSSAAPVPMRTTRTHISQPARPTTVQPNLPKEPPALLREPQEYIRLLVPLAKKCEQSPRFLKVILERHNILREMASTKRFIDDELSEALTSLLGREEQFIPAFPESWLFVGDLADEFGIPEPSLLRLFVQKNISKEHFRVAEVRGINGWIGFCSKELANMLRRQHNNLKQA